MLHNFPAHVLGPRLAMPKPTDWLEDFVECFQYGEAPERVLYWVGVSTIAGALGRKVWIDEELFKWYPNFYILIVGPPGEVKKSTSITLGMSMLAEMGADMGPEMSTWQALISHMADNPRLVKIGMDEVPVSCVTMELSEFGTFFDATDHWLGDALVRLWDNKPGPLLKETKKEGTECIENPWLNILAATTPKWLAENFPDALVGGGLASRILYVHVDHAAADVAYPSQSKRKPGKGVRAGLVERLREIGNLSGEYHLTPQAYEWGTEWYTRSKERIRASGTDVEGGFLMREQTQLHKLAMVISAARGKFPEIGVSDLIEADMRLRELFSDVQRVFDVVGQTGSSRAASTIVDMLAKHGPMTRRELYRRGFFRTMKVGDFLEALGSTIAAGLVQSNRKGDDPTISLVK